MKHFQLEGIINEELLNKFLDFINTNPEEEITIYLNTDGGKRNSATVILSIINAAPKRFTVVGCNIGSAAFYIFYFAKCERKLIYACTGIWHKAYLKNIVIDESGEPLYIEDISSIKNLKETKINIHKYFMNDKELKKYKKGEDIYFTFKRLTQIFPNAKIIGNPLKGKTNG